MSPRGLRNDRFLELKALLLVIGAGLGLAGMATQREWLVWAAIVVVASALVLRLIGRRSNEQEDE